MTNVNTRHGSHAEECSSRRSKLNREDKSDNWLTFLLAVEGRKRYMPIPALPVLRF